MSHWYPAKPMVLTIQEVEAGGSWYEGGLGKRMRLYLKNKIKAKGLGLIEWLKW
jgi:hypothetical protein